MNTKRRVDKTYKVLDETHAAKWERLSEYKIGRRICYGGEVFKIHGQRAATFELLYAERNRETGAINLTFTGGKNGHRLTRTFTPDKVGKFLYIAQHSTDDD